MKKIVFALVAVGLLAACDDKPQPMPHPHANEQGAPRDIDPREN